MLSWFNTHSKAENRVIIPDLRMMKMNLREESVASYLSEQVLTSLINIQNPFLLLSSWSVSALWSALYTTTVQDRYFYLLFTLEEITFQVSNVRGLKSTLMDSKAFPWSAHPAMFKVTFKSIFSQHPATSTEKESTSSPRAQEFCFSSKSSFCFVFNSYHFPYSIKELNLFPFPKI